MILIFYLLKSFESNLGSKYSITKIIILIRDREGNCAVDLKNFKNSIIAFISVKSTVKFFQSSLILLFSCAANLSIDNYLNFLYFSVSSLTNKIYIGKRRN